MIRLRSGHGIPAALAAALPRGEKVLAWAETDVSGWVVGSRDRLHLVEESGQVRSLPWERVHRADWDKESATLTVQEVAEYGEPMPSYTVVVREPGDLAALVRERVTASVVLQRRVDLQKRRGFSVIGRRAPSRPGEVTWAFELDSGLDPEDPEVRRHADAALASAQESLGL